MNEMDDVKLLRQQEERKFINAELTEGLARGLLEELTDLANKTIFKPRDGELTFEFQYGWPTAGVDVNPSRPFHPRMVFRTSLISDMYADAFTFPVYSSRIAAETRNLSDFNNDPRFENSPYRFTTAVPTLTPADVAPRFSVFCEAFVLANQKVKSDERQLKPDDVRCRFIMFELMLAWTFFHELGHVVQGHYKLRSSGASTIDNQLFLEMEEEIAKPGDHANGSARLGAPDLPGQARELMADAEATSLMFKYLCEAGRLRPSVWYLLRCAMGCMFQRFYANYPDSLELSPAKHPHPVIREHASDVFSLRLLSDWLIWANRVETPAEAASRIAYLHVRASLITGIFRANRFEKRSGPDQMPSYMDLTQNGTAARQVYIEALLPELRRQVPLAGSHHLLDSKPLEFWLTLIEGQAQSFKSR